MPRKKELSFEESLEKLEQIVAAMESGDSSLQELMANYAEGVKLGGSCLTVLEQAEKTMDVMIQDKAGRAIESELQIEGE